MAAFSHCVPRHLDPLDEERVLPCAQTVPLVSKCDHRYIICSVALLVNPFSVGSETTQLNLTFVQTTWESQKVDERGLLREDTARVQYGFPDEQSCLLRPVGGAYGKLWHISIFRNFINSVHSK